MILEISCPICDSSRYSFFLNVQGVDGQAYQIYRCSNCSHRYVSPPPDQAILEKVYDAFQSGMYLDMAIGNYHEWYKAAIEDAKSEICFIFSLFMTPDPKTAKLKILDYGAGVGCFSYAADKLGLVPLAVDVDKHSLQIAADQGIKTHHVSFPLMAENLPEGSWDIVAMREVIEHMADPVRDVSMLSRLLKKKWIAGWACA